MNFRVVLDDVANLCNKSRHKSCRTEALTFIDIHIWFKYYEV